MLLAGVIFSGYYLWKNREKYFFQGGEVYQSGNPTGGQSVDKVDDQNSENSDDVSTNDEESNPTTVGDPEDRIETSEILEKYCGQKCRSISDPADYDYCLEICGLKENNNVGDCEGMEEGMERDVCWKNKAINEKNASLCDKIFDGGLKEACQNRVLEDILDEKNVL